MRSSELVFAVTCLVFPASSISAQAGQRDSAGIRIVSYQPPNASASLVKVVARPHVVIADSDSCQFNRIRALLVQGDGSYVVANSGNLELCFFDSTGRFLHRVGRDGSGPAEYRSMDAAHLLPGDSVLVWDPMLYRLTVLSPNGAMVRTIPITLPSDSLGSVWLTAVLSNGAVVVGFSEFRTAAPRPEPVYFMQRIYRFDTQGRLLGALGRFPASEHFIQAVPRQFGGTAYWDLAFGRRLSLAPLARGFLAGDGSDWTVGEYDQAGTPVALHRVSISARSITSADISAYKRTESATTVRPLRQLLPKLMAEMPFPKAYPAFRRLLSDPAGRAWAEVYPPLGASIGEWLVLDFRTRQTSTVTFPSRFRPLAILRSSVCGVERDDNDVESIRCFRIAGPS